MKLVIILFFLFLSFSACNESPENPVDNNTPPPVGANIGEDQESYVGSYAILDASQSILPEEEELYLMDFIQDSSNPHTLKLFGSSDLSWPQTVGFESEGIYNLELNIICESGKVYKDSIVITVFPRQVSLIEDVNLEITIRHQLKYKEGELNEEKLRLVDSLSTAFLPLNKINSIAGLEYCVNARYLLLSNQNITNLEYLANLTKLEHLNLNQNRVVEDITPLRNLTNLATLILYSNPIEDISILSNLVKLRYLDLNWIPIDDISSIANLVSLEKLYLSGVGTGIPLSNIEPLRNLLNLKHLSISGRYITNIEPLKNLTELDLLDLSFNDITEISPVSNLNKLVRLEIRRNKVQDISGIRYLQNLDYLDAADNMITDISELEFLEKIHLIGLSRNKIEDLLPLVNNTFLGEGVHLFIAGNPLNDQSINEYIPILEERGVIVNR